MPDPIKVMQNEMACVNRQITGCDRDCIKCDLVLEDSEIIAAYEAAIEALELQTPKKLDYGRCPNCGVYFGRGELFGNWCQYCGQRLDIDWSEVEE